MNCHAYLDLVLVLAIVFQAFWLHAKDRHIDEVDRSLERTLRDLMILKANVERKMREEGKR